MKRIVPIALYLIVLSTQAPLPAADVDEIVARTNHVAYYQGADGRARVTMRIVGSDA